MENQEFQGVNGQFGEDESENLNGAFYEKGKKKALPKTYSFAD